MDEAALTAHLRATYPKEDEAREWKEFKNLKNSWNSRQGDDVESYVSAIANMCGGHLVLGVKDASLDSVGIHEFGDFTLDNARYRLAGRCSHLNTEKLTIESFTTSDTGKAVWVLHIPQHEPRLPVYAHGKPWQRVGDSLVQMRPERLDAILREPIDHTDWSAKRQFKSITEHILRLAREDSDVRRMMTIPGIGALTALCFKSAIDDPRRFSSSTQVGPYLGLTPRQYQSGDSDWTGSIGQAADPLFSCTRSGATAPSSTGNLSRLRQQSEHDLRKSSRASAQAEGVPAGTTED